MKLNEKQTDLKFKLKEFIEGKENGFFGVLGAGGTGKTFTICQSISVEDAIFLGATNKVVGVIKTMLKEKGHLKVKAKTLDSFFNFKMEKDHENRTLTSHRMPQDKDIPKIIVIDEISMITDRVCELLLQLKDRRKIILMGDDMQLPPISTDEDPNGVRVEGFLKSRIFIHIDRSVTLTEQVRQTAGTDLFKLVSGFRGAMNLPIAFNKIPKIKANGLDIKFFMDDDRKFLDFLRKEDDAICVCYKNLTALSFNWLVGTIKSGKKNYKVNKTNVGDIVLFDSFYKSEDTTFFTSEKIEVLEIEDNCTGIFAFDERTISYPYSKMKVKRVGENTKFIIRVAKSYDETLRTINSRLYYDKSKFKSPYSVEDKKYLSKLNTAYNDFKNSFANLKKPFGITSHKAQGSTYDSVIIPVYDFGNRNHQDVNQLFYVAMSRAKKNIIFVDRKSLFNETGNRYSFSEYEKNAICSHHDYMCADCGSEYDDIRKFDIDHKKPLADGGNNTIMNLQPLCKQCHKNKSAFEKSVVR
ncbi:AAA family ATPase [Pedobacter antarcticus]|uniref:AAA family ATPase n=1 Tax=Pedobacter antarcticus TaxID=34086 RepID=UPI00292D704F|nr:AAA family ATPase [Pedobacter antarcticus]